MGERVSGTGAWDIKTRAPLKVAQRKYFWGDRLKTEQIEGAGLTREAARRFAGMVKFQVKDAKGKGKDTQYMTFRVMTEDSPGWIVPAQPGKHIARDVAAMASDRARSIIEQAVIADIRAAYENI